MTTEDNGKDDGGQKEMCDEALVAGKNHHACVRLASTSTLGHSRIFWSYFRH